MEKVHLPDSLSFIQTVNLKLQSICIFVTGF